MLAGIDDLVYFIEASERLKYKSLAHISKQAFAYLSHIYESIFNEKPTLPHELNSKIIAETMKDLIHDIVSSRNRVQKL